MSRFAILAEDAIKEYKGGDIDSHLEKIAESNNLNKNEHQRLIEEYNIGAFLKKLADGSQHEEYDVAKPVVVSSGASEKNGEKLKKVASTAENFNISPDMFSVDVDDFASPEIGQLEKVASANIDDELMNIESKWEEADKKREAVLAEEKAGLEKLAKTIEVENKLGKLLKIASTSEGMTKTAVSALAMSGLDELSLTMLENSKYSSFDIRDAKAEELPKEAKEIITELSRE
jgi:hypothetical protein